LVAGDRHLAGAESLDTLRWRGIGVSDAFRPAG